MFLVFYGWTIVLTVPILSLYVLFWALESLELIDYNPIDILIYEYVYKWGESAFQLDLVRMPLIYLEYQVTLLLGTLNFDYNSPEFLLTYFLLSLPWVWLALYFLGPFLVFYAPGLYVIWYWYPEYFADEYWIYDDTGEEDLWGHERQYKYLMKLEEKWQHIADPENQAMSPKWSKVNKHTSRAGGQHVFEFEENAAQDVPTAPPEFRDDLPRQLQAVDTETPPPPLTEDQLPPAEDEEEDALEALMRKAREKNAAAKKARADAEAAEKITIAKAKGEDYVEEEVVPGAEDGAERVDYTVSDAYEELNAEYDRAIAEQWNDQSIDNEFVPC